MRHHWIAAAALVVLTSSGCLRPRTTSCGALVCPVGDLCDEHRDACVLPGQVSACEGLAEQAACSYPGEDHGACDHGVCHTIECGNGLLEPGEICDDGNTTPGDGCGARCDSNELCGNGVVDPAAGEACDDGGKRSHDGCSSQCRAEVPTWRSFSFAGTRAMTAGELAYDAARGRVMSFGGREGAGAALQLLTSFDGTQWITLSNDGAPPPRYAHVWVYDAKRRQVLAFGGDSGTMVGLYADTWTWDGAWTKRQPTTSPSARRGAAAAYDGARDRVVMFGGNDGTNDNDETWLFDGSTWSLATVASPPPARHGHRLAYDAHRQRVVMLGGSDASGMLDDTWEWDGTSWTLSAALPPTARGGMVYDAGRERVVAYGGNDTPNADTWTYDGLAWTQLSTTTAPTARLTFGMAYDAARDRTVVYAGGNGTMGFAYNDTWELSPTGWTIVTPTAQPPARNVGGFAFDRLHGVFLMVGGLEPPNTLYGDTWAFDGAQWQSLAVAGFPQGGACPGGPCPDGMAYDELRRRMVFLRFGMSNTMETWIFDGARWTRQPTANAPSNRQPSGIVYVPTRDRVVLFGGGMGPMMGPSAMVSDETWELDGSDWTQQHPAVSPPARAAPSFAYDRARDVVVLFGGHDAMGKSLGDTWEYDGVLWTPIAPIASPPARAGAGMAYDETRARIILFGGADQMKAQTDVWEYDGTTWTQLAVQNGPMPRSQPGFAYDPVRKTIVLAVGDPTADTWTLSYQSVTPDEICTDGADNDGDGTIDCADPDCDGARCAANMTCNAGTCACAAAKESACGDGLDDDCDGQIDCADPDCVTTMLCAKEIDCANGLDDDGDGYIDCADPGCTGTGACEAHETSCGDGVDNDGDGTIDCADPDCYLVACESVQ